MTPIIHYSIYICLFQKHKPSFIYISFNYTYIYSNNNTNSNNDDDDILLSVFSILSLLLLATLMF